MWSDAERTIPTYASTQYASYCLQRYGPPPSYPNLKIPGLNAPIPPGASFGYHAGGWGKPPVDSTGHALYGDVFGLAPDEGESDTELDKTARSAVYLLIGSLLAVCLHSGGCVW